MSKSKDSEITAATGQSSTRSSEERKTTTTARESRGKEKILQERTEERPGRRANSPHMVARWYRPPEIILGSSDYDHKVDIWSLGCIFAEVAWTWSSNQPDPNSRYLFKGFSCYPLSPSYRDEKETKISRNDQLIKILETIGPQDDEQLRFLNPVADAYVRKLQ